MLLLHFPFLCCQWICVVCWDFLLCLLAVLRVVFKEGDVSLHAGFIRLSLVGVTAALLFAIFAFLAFGINVVAISLAALHL